MDGRKHGRTRRILQGSGARRLEHFFHNEYYPADEQYLFALADAMKHEYKAIVDAGFILQLDIRRYPIPTT
jgi:methionine synthase II (cobalamin-independent)